MTDSQILTLAKRFHTGGRENGYIVPIRKIADALDAPYAAVMRKAAELGAEKLTLGDYLFPAELLDSVDADNDEISVAPPKSADSRENGAHNRRTSDFVEPPKVEIPSQQENSGVPETVYADGDWEEVADEEASEDEPFDPSEWESPPTDTPAPEPFNPSVSICKGAQKPKIAGNRTLEEIANAIRGKTYKAQIEELRQLNARGESGTYRNKKEKLAGFIGCGVFKDRRNNQNLQKHSGLIMLDFDDLPFDVNAAEFRDSLKEIPECAIAFLSPGGDVKAGFRITPHTTAKNHRSAWEALETYVTDQTGAAVNADQRAKAISQLCFMSHDPDAYYNPNATALEWHEHVSAREHEPPPHNAPKSRWVTGALQHISPDDYETWTQVGGALKDGEKKGEIVNGFQLWDNWSKRSPKYNREEMRYKWDHALEEFTLGTIWELAKQNGWQPPPQIVRNNQRKWKYHIPRGFSFTR